MRDKISDTLAKILESYKEELAHKISYVNLCFSIIEFITFTI